MPIAPDIKAQVEDLLRNDPRLASAAPLLGQVHALISEPKPPPQPKAKKLAPPRHPVAEMLQEAGLADEEDEAKKVPGVPPWLKVAKVKKVTDDLRELFGDKALAYVAVDGWLWNHLDAQGKRAALVFALRGLHHVERASDGGDAVKIERPPLQSWHDIIDEASHLVAALTDDPADAAEQSAALERYGVLEAIEAQTRSLIDLIRELRDAWANQIGSDPTEWDREFPGLAARVAHALSEGPKPVWSPDLVAENRHGDVTFWAEDDGEVSRYEIGWGHCSRSSFSDANWSACGFGLYQGGDLHDGHRSVREVMEAFDGAVYASLEDYKAGRATTITAVLDVARAWAKLPPIDETEDAWLDGEDEDSDDNEGDEE